MACDNCGHNAMPIVGTACLPDQKSSVELTKNSKGEIQYVIKVYNLDPQVALDKALELKKSLEEKLHG